MIHNCLLCSLHLRVLFDTVGYCCVQPLFAINATMTLTVTPDQCNNGTLTITPDQCNNGTLTVTRHQCNNSTLTVTSDQCNNGTLTVTPDQCNNGTLTVTPDQCNNGTLTVTPDQCNNDTLTVTPDLTYFRLILLLPFYILLWFCNFNNCIILWSLSFVFLARGWLRKRPKHVGGYII
jgi:hypothetical protein